jgi:serine protease Do
MVAATPVGEEASVKVLRDGKERELKVVVAKLPGEKSTEEPSAETSQGKWGLMLRDVTPQVAQEFGLKETQGVLIVGVQPGSSADRASLQQGDIILEVNRKPVKSVDEVKKNMDEAGDKTPLLLLVQRDKATSFVPLTH